MREKAMGGTKDFAKLRQVEQCHHVDVEAWENGFVAIVMYDEANRGLGTICYDAKTAMEFAQAIRERAREASAYAAGNTIAVIR